MVMEATAAPDADAQAAAAFNAPALAMGQVFQGTSAVTSMDFHEEGELCVTANADNSITLINALEGKVRKTVHCQKYGAGVLKYTHHDQVGSDCFSLG